MNRREFNLDLVALASLGFGVANGLIPITVLANWPSDAFVAENIEDTVSMLYGTTVTEVTDAITFKTPDIAENGAVVPVTVKVDMESVESVALLVVENPFPLAATFEMSKQSAAVISTRIKMGKTSPLIAIARVDGKLYSATSEEIKVTIGGCGG